MSMQELTAEVMARPEDKWSAGTQVHRQSWTQQVLAAARRLGISASDVRNMTPGTLLVLQEERMVESGRLHGVGGSRVASGLHSDLAT